MLRLYLHKPFVENSTELLLCDAQNPFALSEVVQAACGGMKFEQGLLADPQFAGLASAGSIRIVIQCPQPSFAVAAGMPNAANGAMPCARSQYPQTVEGDEYPSFPKLAQFPPGIAGHGKHPFA